MDVTTGIQIAVASADLFIITALYDIGKAFIGLALLSIIYIIMKGVRHGIQQRRSN